MQQDTLEQPMAPRCAQTHTTAAPVVVIIMGVSGSGKSTIGRALAAATGGTFLDGDDFHPPENIARMRSGIALTCNDRQAWLDSLCRAIAAHAARGTGPCFVACSALKKAYRDVLQSAATGVRFVCLHGSEALIRERLRERKNHFMPTALLSSQLQALEWPADALVVDIAASPEVVTETILRELGRAPRRQPPASHTMTECPTIPGTAGDCVIHRPGGFSPPPTPGLNTNGGIEILRPTYT